ncbi:acyl-CoA dehydrogenase [Proteiniclasticum ruminis]|uniref:Butyryl-CoA dehydrogenase n=1 Tax=Proteiniclasticum ruminis TaxID=398199 RepID=A0A1G8M7M7_9CLOT|nr:acyl-CoA dehydrogenase [Proteiniclasticum ruminis]SDI63895.1 butyryl-CoA dehydrogenase [Proteiniclasticum ruminis]
MNFELNKKQALSLKLFKEFSLNEVKPLAQEVDELERFPVETVEKMAKIGMLGIPVPENYGGSGGDNLTYIMAVEELSKHCATTGVIVSAHTSLACAPLLAFGTEAQKEKYLLPLASGDKLGAFGLTEPNAGSDAAMQQTIAVREGDFYRINGSKIFITNGGYADTFIIFAMTDKQKGTRGISAFIVEKGMEGFSIGKTEHKLGIKGSSTTELIFKDLMLPAENLLGQEGKGFGIAMKTLDGGRIGIAAQALGIAQGALDEAIKYIKERKQFGRPLSAFQNSQFQIAELQTKIDAARLLTYRAAVLKDEGKSYSTEAAMAKLYASDISMESTRISLQLLGGYGYTREYPLERMFRDAKITEIYEGTSEVQKMVIAASLLK